MATIEVRKSVTILKSRPEVFDGLRQRAFLDGLFDDLTHIDPRRLHWAKALVDGGRLEGEVELEELVEDERVAWGTSSSGELPHEGTLWLRNAPGRGTEVTVSVVYDPPAGRVGQLVLRLMGDEPKQVLTRHLYRLRQLLEAGEVPTTDGQPSGREEDAAAAQESQREHRR
jgi:uncharacterized membrane protein